MRLGFFRICVVLSALWVVICIVSNWSKVGNDFYTIQKYDRAQQIHEIVGDITKTKISEAVKKAKANGFDDEEIYYYLFGFTDFHQKLERYAEEKYRATKIYHDAGSREVHKDVAEHLKIKIPQKPIYSYIRAKNKDFSVTLFYFAFAIVAPIALLWILFYVVVWIAAGFSKKPKT